MAEKIASIGLLVSVRSVAEAEIVAPLGITVLDLKEPSAGSLAPTSVEIWEQVGIAFADQVRLSAALGEFDQAIKIAAKVPSSFTFAKAGPAGCQSIDQLQQRWTALRDQLHPKVQLVAVAYADHQAANCPPPRDIFARATELGMSTWLLDTFEKKGPASLDALSMHELKSISDLASDTGSAWVLAGSMRIDLLPQLQRLQLSPAMIGVRGDVCMQSREGELSQRKVESWLTSLSTTVNLTSRHAQACVDTAEYARSRVAAGSTTRPNSV